MLLKLLKNMVFLRDYGSPYAVSVVVIPGEGMAMTPFLKSGTKNRHKKRAPKSSFL
jgi:hypothetical protein